jgi:hypothetical protein
MRSARVGTNFMAASVAELATICLHGVQRKVHPSNAIHRSLRVASEQVAEDRGAELERLYDRERRPADVGVRFVPGADVVFRPEEVDRGSE